MALCDKNQKFLFEVLPDYLPFGRLTNVEVGLWSLYLEQKQERMKR